MHATGLKSPRPDRMTTQAQLQFDQEEMERKAAEARKKVEMRQQLDQQMA